MAWLQLIRCTGEEIGLLPVCFEVVFVTEVGCHRCPFQVSLVKNSWHWFRWVLSHLPGTHFSKRPPMLGALIATVSFVWVVGPKKAPGCTQATRSTRLLGQPCGPMAGYPENLGRGLGGPQGEGLKRPTDYFLCTSRSPSDWCPTSHPAFFWLRDSVPLLKLSEEKSWHPYSNLSTGGPS